MEVVAKADAKAKSTAVLEAVMEAETEAVLPSAIVPPEQARAELDDGLKKGEEDKRRHVNHNQVNMRHKYQINVFSQSIVSCSFGMKMHYTFTLP